MFWLQEMVPVCVARVHSLLPADWDWSGAKATPAALATPTAAGAAAAAAGAAGGAGGDKPAAAGSNEDLRERSELQRAYYSFAHSLVHNGLAAVLLRAPPGTLDAMLGALMRGAATHVDAGELRLQTYPEGWRAGGNCCPCFGVSAWPVHTSGPGGGCVARAWGFFLGVQRVGVLTLACRLLPLPEPCSRPPLIATCIVRCCTRACVQACARRAFRRWSGWPASGAAQTAPRRCLGSESLW